MRRVLLTSLTVCGALLVGTQAQAQTAASAPAAGGTADGMPFDIPYGTPVGLETAKKMIAAVEAEATKHRWKLNIAVVDTHGDLVHFSRMDGAQLASIQIAEHKAKAAATFRRKTVIFENGIQKSGLNYLITLDGAIGSRGGIPLVSGGRIIGAIGCSGGTGSQDEAICEAAAATLK